MNKMNKRKHGLCEGDLVPDRTTEWGSMCIASYVRNAMEDFHCEHLSDAQMKVLNPIIRNAVATILWCINEANHNRTARMILLHTLRCIPDYWERPVFDADVYPRKYARRIDRFLLVRSRDSSGKTVTKRHAVYFSARRGPVVRGLPSPPNASKVQTPDVPSRLSQT